MCFCGITLITIWISIIFCELYFFHGEAIMDKAFDKVLVKVSCYVDTLIVTFQID